MSEVFHYCCRPASVYIDIGDVPLGYVCHFPVVQDIAEANQVCTL